MLLSILIEVQAPARAPGLAKEPGRAGGDGDDGGVRNRQDDGEVPIAFDFDRDRRKRSKCTTHHKCRPMETISIEIYATMNMIIR